MDLIKEIDETILYDNKPVRIIGTYDKPGFVAKDICNILGIVNAFEAIKFLEDDWKYSELLVTANGQKQMMNVLTEAGVYKLMMRTNKQSAQPFQDFICENILPSLRKTGKFQLQQLFNEKDQEIDNIKKDIINVSESLIFKCELTNDKELRILGTPIEPWFIAKDVAEMLGYTDTEQSIRKNVDDDDKMNYSNYINSIDKRPVCATGRKIQGTTIVINESGLYSLILRSKLPKSKEFKRWVTSEVLPSIRKYGEYKYCQYEEKIKQLEEEKKTVEIEYKNLEKNHAELAKKRHGHKFKKGKCFYISIDPRLPKYSKPGSTGNIEDYRLKIYRGNAPDTQIKFLAYLEENEFIENLILHRFSDKLTHPNHEVCYDVSVEEFVETFKRYIEEFKLEVTYEDNLDKYNAPICDKFLNTEIISISNAESKNESKFIENDEKNNESNYDIDNKNESDESNYDIDNKNESDESNYDIDNKSESDESNYDIDDESDDEHKTISYTKIQTKTRDAFKIKDKIIDDKDLSTFKFYELQIIGRKLGLTNVSKDKENNNKKYNTKDLINLIQSRKQILNDDDKYDAILEEVLNTRTKSSKITTEDKLNELLYKQNKSEEDLQYLKNNLQIFKSEELRQIGFKFGIKNTTEIKGKWVNKTKLIEMIITECQNKEIDEVLINNDDDIMELKTFSKKELKAIGKSIGLDVISRNRHGKAINILELIDAILTAKNSINDKRYRIILNNIINERGVSNKTLVYDTMFKEQKTITDIELIKTNIDMFNMDELKNICKKLGITNFCKDKSGKGLIKPQIIKKILDTV